LIYFSKADGAFRHRATNSSVSHADYRLNNLIVDTVCWPRPKFKCGRSNGTTPISARHNLKLCNHYSQPKVAASVASLASESQVVFLIPHCSAETTRVKDADAQALSLRHRSSPVRCRSCHLVKKYKSRCVFPEFNYHPLKVCTGLKSVMSTAIANPAPNQGPQPDPHPATEKVGPSRTDDLEEKDADEKDLLHGVKLSLAFGAMLLSLFLVALDGVSHCLCITCKMTYASCSFHSRQLLVCTRKHFFHVSSNHYS
jgi:hypothetical protein